MATKKQTTANRRNAARCTGSKTPARKAILRRNTQTHGLTLGHLAIRDGSRAEISHPLVGLPLRIPARQHAQRPRGPARSLRLREELPVNRRGGREILVERRATIGDDSAAS